MAKGRTADATPEDLIAEAMAEATLSSGASSLPPADQVPEAFAMGPVLTSAVPEVSEAIIAGTQHAAIVDNPFTPPDVKALAEQMSGALATKAPPAPPVQIGLGQDARIMPSSVRTYAHNLHSTNNLRAKALWDAFVGEHRRMVAVLAQQGGFQRHPFVYLSQAVWQLIELDNWMPKKGANDADFNQTEKDQNSPIYRGLVEWAGPDNARIIVRLAEQVNVSIMVLLYQAYAQLQTKKEALLHKTLTTETVEQWAQ